MSLKCRINIDDSFYKMTIFLSAIFFSKEFLNHFLKSCFKANKKILHFIVQTIFIYLSSLCIKSVCTKQFQSSLHCVGNFPSRFLCITHKCDSLCQSDNMKGCWYKNVIREVAQKIIVFLVVGPLIGGGGLKLPSLRTYQGFV